MLGQGDQQGLGSEGRIRDQGDLRRVVAHGLVGVDIDAQQLTGDLETTLEGHVVVGLGKLGTDRQHHIGFGDQGTGGHQRLGRADLQRVAGRQNALGVDGQGHRRLQVFCQAGQRRAGIDGTTAGEDQRPPGCREHGSHLCNRRRRGASAGDTHRGTGQQVIGVFDQHIQWNLDMHRARPGAIEHGKGAGQYRRQVIGAHQRVGKRRHACHQIALRRQLMQLAAPAAQLVTRLHAGNHQHRNRVSVGLAHGGGDIGHARAGDDEAHARLAAGTRVAVSHEPGALLVARGDVPDARACQPAIEFHGMHAGNSKDMVYAIAFKEFDQYFAASRHDRLPVIVRETGCIGPPDGYLHNAKKLILAMS
ncbi:hypothetical protein D3C79_703010 [compost metagenome]